MNLVKVILFSLSLLQINKNMFFHSLKIRPLTTDRFDLARQLPVRVTYIGDNATASLNYASV